MNEVYTCQYGQTNIPEARYKKKKKKKYDQDFTLSLS